MPTTTQTKILNFTHFLESVLTMYREDPLKFYSFQFIKNISRFTRREHSFMTLTFFYFLIIIVHAYVFLSNSAFNTYINPPVSVGLWHKRWNKNTITERSNTVRGDYVFIRNYWLELGSNRRRFVRHKFKSDVQVFTRVLLIQMNYINPYT